MILRWTSFFLHIRFFFLRKHRTKKVKNIRLAITDKTIFKTLLKLFESFCFEWFSSVLGINVTVDTYDCKDVGVSDIPGVTVTGD